MTATAARPHVPCNKFDAFARGAGAAFTLPEENTAAEIEGDSQLGRIRRAWLNVDEANEVRLDRPATPAENFALKAHLDPPARIEPFDRAE